MSLKTFLISILEGEKMSEPLVTESVVQPVVADATVVAAQAGADTSVAVVADSPLEKLKAKVSAIESAIELFGKEAEAEVAALAEKYL